MPLFDPFAKTNEFSEQEKKRLQALRPNSRVASQEALSDSGRDSLISTSTSKPAAEDE
jgi:hypothetical protein